MVALSAGEAPVCPVRSALQARTRAAHLALHRHAVLRRLLAADLAVTEYRVILERHDRFYRGFEERREHAGAWPDLSLHKRCEAVAADLATLPAAGRHQAAAVRPLNERQWGASANDATEPYALLGGLYVLHGASFGARTLGASLRKHLPALPHHFFGGCDGAAEWQALAATLTAYEGNTSAVDAIVEGAAQTFRAFDVAMHG